MAEAGKEKEPPLGLADAPPDAGAADAAPNSGPKVDRETPAPERDEPTEDYAAQLDDAQGGLDGRSVVTDSVSARAAFIGSTLKVENFIVSSDDRGRAREQVVTTIDITDDIDPATFVEPGFFGPLTGTLRSEFVVAVAGHGCGKETAAANALVVNGHRPILQLPGDLPPSDLIAAVEKLIRERPRSGFLVDAIDPETLGGVAGFELQRIRSALKKGDGGLLMTTSDERVGASLASLAVVEAPADDHLAYAVAERHATARGLGAPDRERVQATIALLAPPVAPRVAVTVVSAVADSADEPEVIASRFGRGLTDDVLAPWLRRHPTPRALASVAAAITFEGVPLADVDAAAADLEERLQSPQPGDRPAALPTLRFTADERRWPDDILTIAREPFNTHFGRQETDVPRICKPHDRQGATASLWHALGPAFREPYLEWVRDAADQRSAAIRWGAGITAGVLFAVDPIIAERELLHPWALDGRGTHRSCAALAVGTPGALGEDPSAARALVKAWGTGDNLKLRSVAVLAYGGLVGAWDPGAAAASHLWRIGEESPELRRSADAALAQLTAAGGAATRARATVMGTLVERLEDRRSRARVYGIVPLIAEALMRRHRTARESLQAFTVENDGAVLAAYAVLLARAFDAPDPGFRSASRAFRHLLDAAAQGRIDDVWLKGLVRHMRDDAGPRGREAALGAQLQRALRAEQRRRSEGAQTAARLLTLFFRTTSGGTTA